MAMRVTATEGTEKGEKLILVSNGVLNFIVQENHAMDIYSLSHKGTNISFLSKNGLTNAQGFGRRFPAGMLYTCGLDAIGGIEGHEPHGNLHTIPAEIVSCEADENGVKIVGVIRDTALFAQNLVLRRTVETKANSGAVTVTDELTNEAFRTEKYCMLYHVNSGYPLVDEGTKVVGKFERSVPRTPWAEKNEATKFEMCAPVDNAEETCYYHTMKTPEISLVNEKLGKKMTVSYNEDNLCGVLEWKSPASGDYVIGLEPCTSFLDGEFRYQTVESGATVKNIVKIEVCDL